MNKTPDNYNFSEKELEESEKEMADSELQDEQKKSLPDQEDLEKEGPKEEIDEVIKGYLSEELNGKEPATLEEINDNAGRLKKDEKLDDQDIVDSIERLSNPENGFLEKITEGDYTAYSLNPVESYGSEKPATNEDEFENNYEKAA